MFTVIECFFKRADGEDYKGYLLENNEDSYPYWVNKYLHYLAEKSPNTNKQYAYRICRFFNFLDGRNTDYKKATKKDLHDFISNIAYGADKDDTVVEGKVTEGTLRGYLTTIKGLYSFIKTCGHDFKDEIIWDVDISENASLLYGSIWEERNFNDFAKNTIRSGKRQKYYVKWYTQDQIDAILNAFSTIRDKAVFSLTLDGLRIDEALSLQKKGFNPNEGTYTLYRSKGKETGNVDRVAILSKRSVELLNDYVFSERDLVEDDLLDEEEIIGPYMFVNLKKRTESYGKPVSYRNWIQILKTAAGKAGLDPNSIRTHSGRSTRAQELFDLQADNPAELQDSQIQQIMGWKSIQSAEPYKNRQDRKTALKNIKYLEDKNKDEDN